MEKEKENQTVRLREMNHLSIDAYREATRSTFRRGKPLKDYRVTALKIVSYRGFPVRSADGGAIRELVTNERENTRGVFAARQKERAT